MKSFSNDELSSVLKQARSVKHAMQLLGLSVSGKSHKLFKQMIVDKGFDLDKLRYVNAPPGPKGKIPLEQILVQNSLYENKNLKRRLLKERLIADKCNRCEVSHWQGEKLSLHLDHINGCNSDNRIENLRLLCPNCHSLTPTYAGKNNRRRQD